MENLLCFFSRMIILLLQRNLNIFYIVVVRVVNLILKFDFDIFCLNFFCGLRIFCFLLVFVLGGRRGLNFQMEFKWLYQRGKEVMQRLGVRLGQYELGEIGKKRMDDFFFILFFLLVKMDCGLVFSCFFQFFICNVLSFFFQEDKVIEFYFIFFRNISGKRFFIFLWMLFFIVGEKVIFFKVIF